MDLTAKIDEIAAAVQAAPPHAKKYSLIEYGLSLRPPGTVLEFGTGPDANTAKFLAKHVDQVYSFDSFHGLPEDWDAYNLKGHFSTGGKPPKVPKNVEVITGWFHESLPAFLMTRPDLTVSFLHIDCDLYSSTKTVLEHLHPRLVSGAVIQFDEFWDYPDAKDHEIKAFAEFVLKHEYEYACLGRTTTGYSQASFRVSRKGK